MDLGEVDALKQRLGAQVGKVIIGQEEAVDLLMIALLSRGHVLLEGMPGTAKTLLVQAFAASLSLEFGRIQFTPDLMPGDLLGTNLFNFQTNQFVLTKGPVFTQLLLADEVNRSPPKTQASLLQAMHEHAVTIDGTTHDLGRGFMVIATQNPIEQHGTYPLPEAQLDRFLFKHLVGYPARDEELRIVDRHGHSTIMPSVAEIGLEPVADLDALETLRRAIAALRLSPEIIAYVVDLIRATREHPSLQFGTSPRSAAMLAAAARARAALEGRDFVIPDDVKALARPVLRHRVVLAPAAEMDGLSADDIVGQLLESVPAPR